MTSYREAAAALWGEAGAYVHDSYAWSRGEVLPAPAGADPDRDRRADALPGTTDPAALRRSPGIAIDPLWFGTSGQPGSAMVLDTGTPYGMT